jgi:hypothetical protein
MLFEMLLKAGFEAEDFRYVLWQQGESDVLECTNPETYKERILTIKNSLEKEWGFTRPWVLAKSTYNRVTIYDPEHEGWIRQAIDELWYTSGFLRGPDTDILGEIGIYRASKEASGHFTLIGQRMAGMMWFSALWNHLVNYS